MTTQAAAIASGERLFLWARLAPLMLALLCTSQAFGQIEAAPAPTADELEARRAEIASELAAVDPHAAGASTELLGELDRLLSQQIAMLSRIAASAATPIPVDDGRPPFSVRQLDATAQALGEAVLAAASARGALVDAQAAVESARDELERSEKARRLAKDARSRGDAAAGELERTELESRIASALLELRRAELRNWEQQRQRASELVGNRKAALEYQRANLEAKEAEHRDILTAIDKQAFDLERREAQQKYAVDEAERMLARSEAAYEAEPEPARRALLEAGQAALTGERRIGALLAERRSRLERSRAIWERRFQLFEEAADRSQSAAWQEETIAADRDLEREARLKHARLSELERELASLGPGEPASPTRAKTLERLLDAYRDDLSAIAEQRFLASRLSEALEQRSIQLRIFDRLAAVRDIAASAWSYELWTSDDSPITVAKMFSAFAVFAIGFLLARAASQTLGKRVFTRLRRDAGAVHAFESLAFYAMLVLVFLTALRVVNIPLTAFAVVGGALAIGIGFGSQNVVNNFISGVILLAERPIKLGDLIEVGDVYGEIERIGLRSTRVRTGDNVHIILPNSSMLETQVVNWTHNDPKVRVTLKVGIAYGSPTRDAERLIRQALTDHPKVHPTPEPIILFADFGDNALAFEARFWITMRHQMERLKIESELRFELDDAFREAGITIAFPQRDVHLDTLQPLEVRVLGSEESR